MEQKNNGRGIFYGVIGVATLVVAIIGATFAYFTATASNNNVITGNMASITFDLAVKKVTTADAVKGGMIPMSNSMVEAALKGTDAGDTPQICVDDNGNAVCQVYKISVVNGGSAGMFLDGYVSLVNGSGEPTDVTTWANIGESATGTTMRWAQAFCTGPDNALTSCTTAGVTTSTATAAEGTKGFGATNWDAIDLEEDAVSATSGFNTDQIIETGTDGAGFTAATTTGAIQGNNYDIISTNYIRISDRSATATSYDRQTDITSALVFNQFIAAMTGTSKTTVADNTDSSESLTDVQVYYIVVWLSETGYNQTAGSGGTAVPAEGEEEDFFQGNVTFISAQGSEVTATFSGYAAVRSDKAVTVNEEEGS